MTRSLFERVSDDNDPWEGDCKPPEKKWRRIFDNARTILPHPQQDLPVRPPASDYFFAMGDTDDGRCIVFCPRTWWNRHKAPFPAQIDLQGMLPSYMRDEPDMVCTWILRSSVSFQTLRHDLQQLGYVHHPHLEKAIFHGDSTD